MNYSETAPWSYWRCLQAIFHIISRNCVANVAEDLSQAQAWDLALKCAREHRSLPALAAALQREPDALAGIPQEIGDTLRQAQKDAALRDLGIYAQAIKLTEVLNRGDIAPVFLKGTAMLLAQSERDFGRREQVDIDLVVPPDQLVAASELLRGAGYRFTPIRKDGSLDFSAAGIATSRALSMSRYHHHLLPLVHPERSLAVELHKYPLPAEFNQIALLKDLLANASERRSYDVTFKIPSVESQIIQLVLGNFIHDGHAAAYRFPLRAADDYMRLLGRCDAMNEAIDWDRVRNACGSHLARFKSVIETALYPGEILNGTGSAGKLGAYFLEKRYVHERMAGALDNWARLRYLFSTALHNPGKIALKLTSR
jgi:hypothetical protein